MGSYQDRIRHFEDKFISAREEEARKLREKQAGERKKQIQEDEDHKEAWNLLDQLGVAQELEKFNREVWSGLGKVVQEYNLKRVELVSDYQEYAQRIGEKIEDRFGFYNTGGRDRHFGWYQVVTSYVSGVETNTKNIGLSVGADYYRKSEHYILSINHHGLIVKDFEGYSQNNLTFYPFEYDLQKEEFRTKDDYVISRGGASGVNLSFPKPRLDKVRVIDFMQTAFAACGFERRKYRELPVQLQEKSREEYERAMSGLGNVVGVEIRKEPPSRPPGGNEGRS